MISRILWLLMPVCFMSVLHRNCWGYRPLNVKKKPPLQLRRSWKNCAASPCVNTINSQLIKQSNCCILLFHVFYSANWFDSAFISVSSLSVLQWAVHLHRDKVPPLRVWGNYRGNPRLNRNQGHMHDWEDVISSQRKSFWMWFTMETPHCISPQTPRCL